MTWTYDPSDLSSDLAQVRLLIGDTNADDPLLTDEEIGFFVARKSNATLAAADCCDAIVAKLARDIDRSNLGMSAQRSQKVQHYIDLAKRLREEAATLAEVYFGGGSYAERDTVAADTDFPKHLFTRDRDANRR